MYSNYRMPQSFSVFDYNSKTLKETSPRTLEDCLPVTASNTVTWLNIEGRQPAVITELGQILKLHTLVQESITTSQRPKVEYFDDYVYLVLKMMYFRSATNKIVTEQLSIILGQHWVVTFQDGKIGDVFDTVRRYLRDPASRVRQTGADYLVYTLIDTVVDHYFSALEQFDERLEELENELLEQPSQKTVHKLHRLKREIILLRKSVWPLREVINSLQREQSTLIQPATAVYLRDVYDHTIQVIDTVETTRDILSGMIDIYLSSVSNRMNAIMKVLTIITTIFMPLTLIASIYGMNFRYIPGADLPLGFYLPILSMALITVVMVGFIKRRGWF